MQGLTEKFKVWRHPPSRRAFLFTVAYSLVVSTTLLSCGTSNTSQQQAAPIGNASPGNQKQVVRIARQKQLIALAALEQQGNLEKALEPLGFTVRWIEFAAGPQQLEALNAGSLDIAYTAESPPVFAQAAGAPLVYLVTMAPNGKAISLLVPSSSSAKRISDLKGKRIAVQKASIGHYLLVKALEQEGLRLSDIKPIYMPPPEANVAFSQAQVDGWFIWDPYATRAEQNKAGRVLLDGEKLRDTANFYSTTRSFARERPEVIKVFLEELQKTEIWAGDHPKEMAQLLTSLTELDAPTLERMHEKYEYGLRPISEQTIRKQQEVADMWYSQNLLPKKVDVREGFLTPKEYAAFTPRELLTKR